MKIHSKKGPISSFFSKFKRFPYEGKYIFFWNFSTLIRNGKGRQMAQIERSSLNATRRDLPSPRTIHVTCWVFTKAGVMEKDNKKIFRCCKAVQAKEKETLGRRDACVAHVFAA